MAWWHSWKMMISYSMISIRPKTRFILKEFVALMKVNASTFLSSKPGCCRSHLTWRWQTVDEGCNKAWDKETWIAFFGGRIRKTYSSEKKLKKKRQMWSNICPSLLLSLSLYFSHRHTTCLVQRFPCIATLPPQGSLLSLTEASLGSNIKNLHHLGCLKHRNLCETR